MPTPVTAARVIGGILQKPPPTFAARWTVLGAMSLALFGSYYAFDTIGPLAPVLTRQLQFSNSQVGLLQASYSLPNVFVLLAAGVLIDRIGAKKSMLAFGIMILSGLVITAVTPRIPVMVAGRLMFGLAAESLAMATHVAIARWFLRDELNLAFALRSSACRLGSLTAQTSPTWAAAAYAYWQWPLLLSVGFGSFCILGTALYWVLDTRGDARFELAASQHKARFAFADFFQFNRSFWLLAGLCICFYSCVFPFQTFGQKFMIEARAVTPTRASLLIGMDPLFSLCLMPVFGHLADRYGNRALLMAIGSLLLVPVFLLLTYTPASPFFAMVTMGVAFALVPAVLWMSVVLVVDRTRIGFASAVVDAVQQIGLVVTNLLIGWTNDRWQAGVTNPAGYRPGMWIFTGLAMLAVCCAMGLRRVETGPHAHGLETLTSRL
ncbi:MAG TPA: MFS transporter [Vicinamibacterales bacterium]|nr:MFS transporter [Vicinamibacterales bacterium]